MIEEVVVIQDPDKGYEKPSVPQLNSPIRSLLIRFLPGPSEFGEGPRMRKVKRSKKGYSKKRCSMIRTLPLRDIPRLNAFKINRLLLPEGWILHRS